MKYLEDKKLLSDKNLVCVVYILYALSYLFGFTSLIGVIIAHVKKSDFQESWIRDHFKWQIKTFWISVFLGIVGLITLKIGIGWFILAGLALWNIYRIVKGWLRYNDGISPY